MAASPRFRQTQWAPPGPLGIDFSNPLSVGLISYYRPAVSLQNLVSAGTALSLTNTATTTVASARGTVPNFNGSTGFLSASDVGLPAGNSPRSMSCWFRWAGAAVSTSTNTTLLSYGTMSSGQAIFVYLSGTGGNTGCISISQFGGGANSTGRVDDGLWHHCLAIQDTNNWAIYIDGKNVVGAVITTNTVLSGLFSIGHDVTNNAYWNGQIDHVAIWNRGIPTAQDALRLYQEPFGLLRSNQRRVAYLPVASSSVFFTGLVRLQSAGRAIPTPSTLVVGKTESAGAARATPALTAPLTGKTEAAGAGKASPGLATTVAGVTRAAARGRASSSAGAILSALARTGIGSAGRATSSITTSIVGKSGVQASARAASGLSTAITGRTIAAAQGRATTAAQANLFAAARAGGAAAGKAAASLATAIVGRSQARVVAAAVLSSGASLSGKVQAGAQGRASSTSGAILVGIARTGGAAAGRAAASVVTTIAGRSQAKAAAQLTPSAGTVLTGKSRAAAQLRASSSSGAVLVGVARTGGAASGRARVSLTSSLTGATTSSARGRAGLGVSLTAVGRTFARLTARLFAGARPPSVFDIGHGVTIPTDTRLASVQADSRAVTLSGSV